MHTDVVGTRARLAAAWIFVMLNMVYADILSFMSPGVLAQFLEGRAEDIVITPGFLLIAAVATEVPIAMVLLSLLLPQRAARWANLIAVVVTMAYVWGMGSAVPHYVFLAGAETLACVAIAWWAWTWRPAERRVPTARLATE